MEFYSIGLINSINQLRKKLTINFFYTLFIFLAFSFILYLRNNKHLDIVFFVCEFVLLISLLLIEYTQIVVKGEAINKTAVEVRIDDENISITTAAFRVLFWINKPAEELKFKLTAISISRVPYKLKEIYDLDYAIHINDRIKSAFIITDYFEKDLKLKLQEIAGRDDF